MAEASTDVIRLLSVTNEPDLVRAILRGWDQAAIPDSEARQVVQALHGVDLAEHADAVASLLDAHGEGPTAWDKIREARELADEVWDALEVGIQTAESTGSALEAAINDSAGHLAMFAIRSIAADWREAGDAWDGLTKEHRSRIERMLRARGERGVHAETVILSQLHFFHAADDRWTSRELLPRLDWSDAQAARNWGGFLSWGRWTDALLADGLLERYLATVDHTDQLTERESGRLAKHLADIATRSQQDPRWIGDFTMRSASELREAWLRQIGWSLKALDAAGINAMWSTWGEDYWTQRASGIPRPLTDGEATALLTCLPHLVGHLSSAIALALRRPAGVGDHAEALEEFEVVLNAEPRAASSLLAAMLEDSAKPFFGGCYKLEALAPHLPGDLSGDIRKRIVESAMRLGCPPEVTDLLEG